MGFSETCSRCGDCCNAIPCGISLCFFEDIRPCPALESNSNGKYGCGLVLHASKYIDVGKSAKWKDKFLSKLFSHMLGVGYGCCSSPTKTQIGQEMKRIRTKALKGGE